MTGYDATADFARRLNDPRQWVIKPGVPVFKCHKRVDPATGRVIEVNLPKLYRIAANMRAQEYTGGVPVRMTLGHTEPGKPEIAQPPVGGYYRNPRVQKFGPKGEPAIVVDEWLDPNYIHMRKNYPYRSAEYYDDTQQITGVALLTRDPFLDLGVVAYARDNYTRSLGSGGVVHYSRAGLPPAAYCLIYPTGEPNVYPMNPQIAAYSVPFGAVTAPVPAAPAPVPYAQAPTQYAAPAIPPGFVPTVQPAVATVDFYGNPVGTVTPPAFHQHTHAAAPTPYNGMPPYMPQAPMMNNGAPPMGGGGGGNTCPHCGMPMGYDDGMGGNGGGDAPFPQGQAPMIPAARNPRQHGTAGQVSGYPASPQGWYGNHNVPTPYTNPAPGVRTISGHPVGYAVALDQMNYQLQESNRAIQVLMYERDRADTAECVAHIRRLATMGYQVGDPELYELKAKPREQREGYIAHIMQRYQKVPTENVPPVLGDPTPGAHPAYAGNMPLTQEQMQTALKLSARGMDYSQAMNYARAGASVPAGAGATAYMGAGAAPGYPPMGGTNFAPPGFGAPQMNGMPQQYAWDGGMQAPQSPGNPFGDPYGGF